MVNSIFGNGLNHFRGILRLLILCFALGCVPMLMAHPNGSSVLTIDLKLPDSLILNVNANMGDIGNSAGVFGYGQEYENPESMCNKIQSYLFSRLPIAFDGEVATNMEVIRWKENGNGPTDLLDSSNLRDSIIDISIYFPVPEGAKEFQITAQTFAEYGILALANTKVNWKGKELYQEIVPLDKSLFAPLTEEKLQARMEELKKAEERLKHPPPKPFSEFFKLAFLGSFSSIYWPLVLGALFVIFGRNFIMGPGLLLLHALCLYVAFFLSAKGQFSFDYNLGQAIYALGILFFGFSIWLNWKLKVLAFPVALFTAFLMGSGLSSSLFVFGMNPQDFQNFSLASALGILLAQLIVALPLGGVSIVAGKGSRSQNKITPIFGILGVIAGVLSLLLAFL